MHTSPHGPVDAIAQVRANLISHLLQFRRLGRSAPPVVFGRDGEPEAVLLSWDAYCDLATHRARPTASA